MEYRPDIDGLRAVSVISVLLFHAHFFAFAGGYVGVDVFFVISGYLITGIVMKEIEAERFSIAGFYERRIRRLLPSLAAVLAATWLFCFLFFLPDDFISFSKSLFTTIFFGSNWFFLSEAGYFDAPSLTKPLLHTWSLAIEEQFYLFFPLALWITMRGKSLNHVTLSVAILCGSLLFSYQLVAEGLTEHAFFNSFGRFWELMLGALIAQGVIRLPDNPAIANSARVVGLGLILYAVFGFSADTPFPGLMALIPVVGAALIIAARPSPNPDFIQAALSHPVTVYIGKISYPLYLWHWPIYVAIWMYFVDAGPAHMIAGMLVAGVFSALCYHFLEIPIRHRRYIRSSAKAFASAGALAGVAIPLAVFAVATSGWPSRLPMEELKLAMAGRHDHNPDRRYCYERTVEQFQNGDFCMVGPEKEQIDFVVWGDSHVDAWMPAFKALAERYGLRGAIAGHGGCPPIPGVERVNLSNCSLYAAATVRYIAKKDIPNVFMVARWSLYPSGWHPDSPEGRDAKANPFLKISSQTSNEQTRERSEQVFSSQFPKTVAALSRSTKVYIVGQAPEQMVWVPTVLTQNIQFRRDSSDLWIKRDAHERRQAFVTRIFQQLEAKKYATFIDPTDLFCSSGTCIVEHESKPLYYDDDHLNYTGAMFVMPILESTFREMAAGEPVASADQRTRGSKK